MSTPQLPCGAIGSIINLSLPNSGWIDHSTSGSPLIRPKEWAPACVEMVPPPAILAGRGTVPMGFMKHTVGINRADLTRDCLKEIRLWPGCETVEGIAILGSLADKFSVHVTDYGMTKKPLADCALRCIQLRVRRGQKNIQIIYFLVGWPCLPIGGKRPCTCLSRGSISSAFTSSIGCHWPFSWQRLPSPSVCGGAAEFQTRSLPKSN
jgi:hypothetical protein